MRHLLVTNDFPPKVGGIQQYLWELWRRLPADDVTVLTTPHDDADAFDAAQPFRVVRTSERVLLPTPSLARRVDALAEEVDAGLVLLDPALPVGALGPRLARPYGLVLHGAEVTVPGRLPVSGAALGRVVRGAALVIAAGGYPAAEAERAAGAGCMPAAVVVPPGVDVDRFRPIEPDERDAVRARFGLPAEARLVVGLSRLVPRKGFDVLMDAVAALRSTRIDDVALAIAGGGRDAGRLERRAAKLGLPVRFLGRVDEDDKPALLGCADVFAMVCRDRWLGLEQEGFGIVFLEAAACGTPQLAGASGGAAEAVEDGITGVVVDRPNDAAAVATALCRLLDDVAGRAAMSAAGRQRAVESFSYDVLARRLADALDAVDA